MEEQRDAQKSGVLDQLLSCGAGRRRRKRRLMAATAAAGEAAPRAKPLPPSSVDQPRPAETDVERQVVYCGGQLAELFHLNFYLAAVLQQVPDASIAVATFADFQSQKVSKQGFRSLPVIREAHWWTGGINRLARYDFQLVFFSDLDIGDVVLGCCGISWTICKQSAPRSRQITTPTPHHSIFLQAGCSF